MRPRPPLAVFFAATFYVVLAIAITWPLALHPGSVVPNDLGDPLLNTWLMAWNARVPPLTAAWWNTPQFFPLDGTMAFSEHLLGLAVITTPVILVSGNPLLAYNAVFFLSFVLSALSAYFLTYTISRRHDCAFVAGLAFGFAPYRMAQLAHVQVLSAYWMPLTLAALHLYVEDRRSRWLVLFAAAWVMQALACGYYLFYLSVLVILWLLWFVAGRERLAVLARVAFVWVAAAALMAPLMYGYWKFQRAYGLRRGPDEIMAFSADVASLLKAPGNLRLWGWLDVVDHPESTLFPGITPVILTMAGLAIAWGTTAGQRVRSWRAPRVLIALGLVCLSVAASALYFGPWKVRIGGVQLLSVGVPHKPFSLAVLCLIAAAAFHPAVRTAWLRRSALAFYALAAAVMWLFSLGPLPTLMDRPILYKAPYAWLMMVPGADGVRVPARFWMLAALCLAVAAGLAVRQLTARWPRIATALPVLASIGLLLDSWPSAIRMHAPPESRPSQTRAVARLELPINPAHDTIALYRAIEHRPSDVQRVQRLFCRALWGAALPPRAARPRGAHPPLGLRPDRGRDRSRPGRGRGMADVRREPSAGGAGPSGRQLLNVPRAPGRERRSASDRRRGAPAHRVDLRERERGTDPRHHRRRSDDALARRPRAARRRRHDRRSRTVQAGQRRRDADRRLCRRLSAAAFHRDIR